MAEEMDPTAGDMPAEDAIVTRRSRPRGSVAGRQGAAVARTVEASSAAPTRTAKPGRIRKPMRSAVILTMVAGLIATVALPAYGAFRSAEEDSVTIQQMALDDAQSLVVASDVESSSVDRESYSATTQAEIDEKKAKEAAEAAAAARAAAASTASVGSSITMASSGSGDIRWPLLNFTKGRGLWDSGYHQGVDLLAPCGTPMYAAAAGVVNVSQESFGGYGVAITIDHVFNGQRAYTTYGHLSYGSRQVFSGQSVAAGQLIGYVGSTGSSTACHLHFEVHINDSVIDPWAWLVNNAG